ncbi:nucleotide pyrophosphohydrolase [Umboniibacter marinipuniceus]|uniref:NTP pyrophosphatase (Non-canonical NTP hydrolase) n=1 Tax=Umboniibacter marinipuniceus TaxID=569599 RepID=A0A3M0ABU5_9GAMM|nr:nucleotide pyrophosphohydrolase [Umboniibacter marinipuniceus]RMA82631.1 NTP pyrophosphatase (non-canonical NTP hydrolase) [Umboniibacter marinipuniceus]
MSTPSDISLLTEKLRAFRDERDWAQFHDAKNLALALSIEAAELNELFLWKNSDDDIASIDREKLSDELADVLTFALLLADKLKLDPKTIIENKILKNEAKYPAELVKGSAKKYNEY